MINLVVPDSVLLGDAGAADGAGWVEGYGEVPGDLIREWIAQSCETGVDVWVRRHSETHYMVIRWDQRAAAATRARR